MMMKTTIYEVRMLRKSGMSLQQTADATGYNKDTVSKLGAWAKRFEGEWSLATARILKHGNKKKPKIDASAACKKDSSAAIKELLAAGFSPREIKEQTGITFAQVKSAMYWPAWFAMEWEDVTGQLRKYYGREPIGQEKRQA